MNFLLVPTLAMDLSLIERLAVSIDFPIRHKVVVNNGKVGALREWSSRRPDWRIIESGENLGVAASWNLAPKLYPQESTWLIVNDDVAFYPGAIAQICKAADFHSSSFPLLYMTAESGFMAFVWTATGVREIGTFDENFWPAYYEDSDMRLRMKLSGKEPHCIFTGAFPLSHGKPPCGGNFNGMIVGYEVFNREYYLRKWGRTDHCGPSFPRPFNRRENPLSFWQIEEQRRRDMMPLWNTFLSIPGCSIYT